MYDIITYIKALYICLIAHDRPYIYQCDKTEEGVLIKWRCADTWIYEITYGEIGKYPQFHAYTDKCSYEIRRKFEDNKYFRVTTIPTGTSSSLEISFDT